MIEGYNRDNAVYFNMLGERLRLARETQGLQISDVAKPLLVTKQRIIEIEEGNYSNISSPLYLRWYLSSYAKLLGLSNNENEIHKIVKNFMSGNELEINASLMDETQKNYTTKTIENKKNSWFYVIFFSSLFLVIFLYFVNLERDSQHIKDIVSHAVDYMFGLG